MPTPRRDRTLTLSINLSGRQLQHPEVVADVADALRGSGLPPNSLVLEMTESVLMDDNETVLTILRQLKELGVRLAIDDFGTGYSSLSYLHRFPVDILRSTGRSWSASAACPTMPNSPGPWSASARACSW
jgi:EAL domain-containing protein (putative c-di-GMP-specific phosphodiesterase class I)